MGPALSAAKDLVKSPTDEQAKQAQDCLTALFELAKLKRDLFKQKLLASNTDSSELPIDKIVFSKESLHAHASDQPVAAESISQAIGSFATGSVLEGITELVKTAVTSLVGRSQGKIEEETDYVVAVGDLGGISRLDYYLFTYGLTSTAFTEKNTTVLCAVIVVSSIKVDPANLTLNTVNVLVQARFGNTSYEAREKMRDQVWNTVNGRIQRLIPAKKPDANAPASPPTPA